MVFLEQNEIGKAYFKDILSHIEQLRGEVSHMALDTHCLLNMATYYYQRGEKNNSFKILDWGFSLYGSIETLVLAKCKILILLKRYEEAWEILDSSNDPNTPNILLERVQLAMLTNQEELAKDFVTKILEKASPDEREDMFTQLTFFFSENHDVTHALECWNAACQSPSHTEMFKLAQIAIEYETNRHEEAFKHCSRLFKKNPDNLIILYYLTALATLLKKTKSQRKYLSILKAIDPLNEITNDLDNNFPSKETSCGKH